MSETLARTLTAPRRQEAINAANNLTDVYSAPQIPVKEIAESTGVDVVFSSFGDAGDKVAGFCDFENRRLYVNARDPLSRQMFTMAHELGHWVLHRNFFDADPTKYRVLPRFHQSVDNPFEREANIFAANLLAPSKLLKPVREAGAARLSDIFGVSRQMMELRLKEI